MLPSVVKHVLATVFVAVLVGCGGGGNTAPHTQLLHIESRTPIAGFQLSFDSDTLAPSALVFDALGGGALQLLRPSVTAGGHTLLVYLPGTGLMPSILESRAMPSNEVHGSTLRAVRCADRHGNTVVCTATWVASQ